MYMCIRVCVCMDVYVRVCVFVCMCVNVCVCVDQTTIIWGTIAQMLFTPPFLNRASH